jgi:DNA-binding NtrC family response regulator
MPFDRCTEVTSKPLSIPARKEEGLEGYVGEKNAAKLEGSIALTILGDPVVGRALMLLLRGSGYDAKFVTASSSSQQLTLKGSDLLLLTPTPELSVERREALVALLRERTRSTKMLVLELTTPSSQETAKGAMEGEWWHYLSWPCMIEELEGSIEATLSVAH